MSEVDHEPIPATALELRESISLSEGALQPDGTIVLDLIRPCVGRGRGKHLYTAEMLRENAHKLEGWRMYVDHLSDEARRRLQGLPRSVRDLGGRVVESWWNPDVPADPARGFGKGAIQGRSKPTPFIRELVENDPEIVQCSLNSHATGVKPAVENGVRVWMVEGIEDKGSVDWVTEAGAGGRVVALMEAAYDGDDQEAKLLESLTPEEFVDYVHENRPDLYEALREATDGGSDGGELEAHGDGGTGKPGAADTEDEVEITPDALREALDSDEGRAVLFMVVNEIAPTVVQELVEAALDEEREVMRVEARADADRQIALRDMRDLAHSAIQESGLPDALAAKAKAKFDLVDGEPTPALNVIDEVDDDGAVTKSATDKLREAVDAEIKEARDLVATLGKPTRVTGQGAKREIRESAEGEGAEGTSPIGDGALGQLLAGSGFGQPDKVYSNSTA